MDAGRLYEATADESKAARLLQEAVFDELWEDTTLRVPASAGSDLEFRWVLRVVETSLEASDDRERSGEPQDPCEYV